MNAHIIVFAEVQILRRASLIQLRDARRLAKRTGNARAASTITREIKRRLCHADA